MFVVRDQSGGPFDKWLDTRGIFKNREYLRSAYTPNELPHRKDQIDQLARIWAAPLRGETPSNVFVYGKTGTGKTATVKHLMSELRKTSKDFSSAIEVVYINCEVINTKYRILANVANKLRETMQKRDPDYPKVSEHVPKTGWPTDQVYDALLETLDSVKQVVVMVLDEIDRLVVRGVDDVLYDLTCINSELRNSRTGIVGISNDLDFVSQLDPRIISRLGEEKVIFPPYDAFQLEDILTERAEMSFCDGVISDAAIRLCAAHAARKHGDARRALDLLRCSGEIAEEDSAGRVTRDHVERASERLERDMKEDAIRALPEQSKLVLLSILLLQEQRVPNIGTRDVYNVYRSLCRQNKSDILTMRRISGLISDLDMMGILEAQTVSRGRYGRRKEVELTVEPVRARAAIEDDIYIKNLDSFSDTRQSKLG
ncbi:cell division control protein Cdc6 [candidate division MSBL1 archaeon SCGC-AAA261F19]|uniref:ORC1-type DNA replication protein n=2 Tax=candidate division MSBL1 TaxID=215777 RepID=A0A133VAK8_9EURY|nr:cell division control protein Cdc6 [candidate division MSBL1 archaeon SCGC-AAA261D19]KXB03435.1 cell division control protein Cdc6 [candidate division MSBL1 archaeon SCGC-AAA261F19]